MSFYCPIPEMYLTSKRLRLTSVIPSLTAGGIGPVCHYAARGMARLTDWDVNLLSLHDPANEFVEEASGLRVICLGLDGNCSRHFLDWLARIPQDLVITSDVSHIEPAYRFLPPLTRHIIQIHDSARRYRDVAVRQAAWTDGVTCVGQHIEAPLRHSLDAVGFPGLLRTVHNGADFPLLRKRERYDGPLRLLFMGRVDALKGVFDFVPLLQRLKRMGVPVTVNIVGGENEILRRQFQRRGLQSMVAWTGRLSHAKCYDIAAESDILLMTSRKEPFGMVTIEAMSMGCVPIAYNIPSGSIEIIEHAKNGILVPLGDISALSEHIRTLHSNRESLTRLSIAAVARARNHFNADVMAKNMADFLTDVMANAERHPSKREAGAPPETAAFAGHTRRGYQRLPKGLRLWIRNLVGANPRLSYWLLSH